MAARKSLFTTLTFAFLAVALLPAVLVVGSLYFFEREGEEKESEERLEGALGAVETEWRSVAESLLRSLEKIGRDGEVARAAWQLEGGDWEAAHRLRRRLEEMAMEENLDFITLADAEGRILARASSRLDSPSSSIMENERTEGAGGGKPIPPSEGGDLRFLLPSGDVSGLNLTVSRSMKTPGDQRGKELTLVGGVLLGESLLSPFAGAAKVDLFLVWAIEGKEEVRAASSATGFRIIPDLVWSRDLVRRAAVAPVDVTSGAETLRMRALLLAGSEGEWPAAVVAVLPLGRTAGRSRTILAVGLAAMILGIMMATGLAVNLSRRVSEPVSELNRAAELVAKGVWERSVPVRREDELGELVMSFNRMTERLQRYRREERRQERIVAWNEVARRLAHQLKNPLTPIRLVVEDFRRSLRPELPEWERMVDEGTRTILGEVKSLERIVEEFTRFARLPEPVFAPLDLGRLLMEVAELYRGDREGVILTSRWGKNVPPVEADEALMRQVFANLVQNALESMEDGGGEIVLGGSLEGAFVRVTIADSGRGMTPEELQRAGEPYFTRRKGGNGLGIAIAERIVLEHGGRLEIESTLGEGTRVQLTIPVRQKDRKDAARDDPGGR